MQGSINISHLSKQRIVLTQLLKWWILLSFPKSVFPCGALYSHSGARLHASNPCENWQSAGRAGTGTVTKTVEQSRQWGLLFFILCSGCQLCFRVGWLELREYLLLAVTCSRLCSEVIGQGFLLQVMLCSNYFDTHTHTRTHTKPHRGERKSWWKKENVGKNIKKHFEMPGSIFTNCPRHSQGQRTQPGPSGGTVNTSRCILTDPSIPQMNIINIVIRQAPLSHCGV